MLVEALYGYWSNSLGLMSDAAHMCFDSTALAISLYASYVSKFPPDDDYPYGYARYEVLSGLINAIFLVFVGFSVLVEGVQRLLEPPVIDGSQLIVVAFLGLGINVVGLFFFRGSAEGEEDDSNLRGVFLHIMADAIGSLGVITSSFFIYTQQLYISDPICSLVISVLILTSTRSLFVDSIKILMQTDVNNRTADAKRRLESVPGVVTIAKFNVWKIAGKKHCLTATVVCAPGKWPGVTSRCAEAVRCEAIPDPVIELVFQ